MPNAITIDREPRFEVDDRVRVVVSSSYYFGWTGTVIASYNGDFELGVIHYHVKLDGFHGPTMVIPPLLFRQSELAFSE